VRLLHTSDWHLGRYLQTEPLLEHQQAFLDWLGALVTEREVDAVLLSGDVYDRAIPAADAVPLLEQGLAGIVRTCPIVVTSGNHDSSTRLGFAGPLLASAGVHLRTSVHEVAVPVEIVGRDGSTVLVYGLPYLEPESARHALGCEKSHEAVLTAAMDRVRADAEQRRAQATRAGLPAPRVVVLAHAFITGGSVSQSERDVSVGGVADAPATVFEGVDYVALGHLHGPQAIGSGTHPVVRYSGTPIAYSFSEEAHQKSVTLVDIDADGGVTVELVPTPVPRPLATLRGDLDDLLTADVHTAVQEFWLRAIVTDEIRPGNALDRLRARFPHLVELEFEPHRNGLPMTPSTAPTAPASADPVEIAMSFVAFVTQADASDEQAELIRASMERVRIAEVSA
jgi:exonuclease SbcD